MSEARVQTPARQGRWTKRERSAQIAAVTLEIIAREGVHSVTLTRIAKAAGIATPSLYNHFSEEERYSKPRSTCSSKGCSRGFDSSSNPNRLERLRELGGSLHEARIAPDHASVIAPLFELAGVARAEGLTEAVVRRNQAVVTSNASSTSSRRASGRAPSARTLTPRWWGGASWDWAGTEDFALLEGLDEIITDGTADAILDRIIESIRPGSPDGCKVALACGGEQPQPKVRLQPDPLRVTLASTGNRSYSG